MNGPLLPLFLDLKGRNVLVVGGGPVAANRVRQLLDVGARVTVVAPDVCSDIRASRATVIARPFRAADVAGSWLVIAAAPRDVNRAVGAAAEAAHVFLNAVDDAECCTAFTGGVLRRGGVVAAFSTGGRAPALAGLLREAVDALLPADAEGWVVEAERLRAEHKAGSVPLARRRGLLLSALLALHAKEGTPL
ncbi:MAG TPA: bifunctional precorrin-2 dehydrogenase/sirohydrochlorin ferrochelatase [Anaeromyxobacteraceae bacterium]|nr:bifunctional precorrin-2 dehydrogenase/sirohydrochlorin ferrochelatase [Anaeromyxobacteraceae bacterium]